MLPGIPLQNGHFPQKWWFSSAPKHSANLGQFPNEKNGDKIKEDGTDGICSTHRRDEKCIYCIIFIGNVKVRYRFGNMV
jgi:hypothetical protein